MIARVDTGGMLRCCVEAVPDDGERYLPGEHDGEVRPCPHSTKCDGVRWVEATRTWMAAWRAA